MAKVAIITANYNGKAHLTKFFESIRAQTYGSIKTIVVDNGSTDGSLQALEEEEDIILVRNERNMGYSRANNQGLRHLDEDTRYLFLLNTDTQMEPDCIGELVKAAEHDESIWAVSPKTLFYHPFIRVELKVNATGAGYPGILVSGASIAGSRPYKIICDKQVYSPHWVGGGLTLYVPLTSTSYVKPILRVEFSLGDYSGEASLDVLVNSSLGGRFQIDKNTNVVEVPLPDSVLENPRHLINNAGSGINGGLHGFDIGFGEEDSGQFDLEREIEAFCDAAVLIRREAASPLLFNESYFAYYEDTDLSLKIRRSGHKLVYAPEARIYHHLWGGSEGSPRFRLYHYTRSRLIFILRNYPIAIQARELGRHILHACRFLLKRDYGTFWIYVSCAFSILSSAGRIRKK